MPIILSLCDHSGEWSRPYREAGYHVVQIDLQHGTDVRTLRHIGQPVHGILMAPPCDHFARVGARWWAEKGDAGIIAGMQVVDACLRAVAIYNPAWWVLENPIGRLQDYLGPPAFKFDPWMYGDPWTKRTWLWGRFNPPRPVAGAIRPDLVGLPGSRDRTSLLPGRAKNSRAATPPGFARAFFEANP